MKKLFWYITISFVSIATIQSWKSLTKPGPKIDLSKMVHIQGHGYVCKDAQRFSKEEIMESFPYLVFERNDVNYEPESFIDGKDLVIPLGYTFFTKIHPEDNEYVKLRPQIAEVRNGSLSIALQGRPSCD